MIKIITGIYKITNKLNSMCYIGQSTHIPRRWSQHKNCLKKNKHYNWKLQKAWNTYGEENFNWEVIYTCKFYTTLNLDEIELKYIKKYNSEEKGYNISYWDKIKRKEQRLNKKVS